MHAPIYCAPPLPAPSICQVGVCASRGDALTVLEYLELDPAMCPMCLFLPPPPPYQVGVSASRGDALTVLEY